MTGTTKPEPEGAEQRGAPAPAIEPASEGQPSARRVDEPPEAQIDPDAIREQVIAQLKTVFDPEIPVNIYELGLVYKVDVAADGATVITMTLTTPMCPAAEELPPEVETKARGVPGVTSVQLDLVWDPPWSPDMMSDAAKLDLGMT